MIPFERTLRKNLFMPIVDRIKKTDMLSVYRELNRTQWLSRRELEDLQLARLRKLLIHAQENVPYYRRLFADIGFDAGRFTSMDELTRIPILTKQTIRKNFADFQAQNRSQFAPRLGHTSGSTGEPLQFYLDRSSHSYGWTNCWRAFSNEGFQLGESIAILAGSALSPKASPPIRTVYLFLMGHKRLMASPLNDEIIQQFAKILSRKSSPRYMYCCVSAAYQFSRYLLKRNQILPLKAIFTTSESLLPVYRESIQSAFDCPVYDTYGNNESCLFAHECRHQNQDNHHLHYSMESAYLEIADDNDQILREGEIGRFIATNLANYAMPMIRYDTGDLGALSSSECACGSGLKLIGQILGRSREFIVTPDGKRIHWSFFNKFPLFYDFTWISSWFICQESRRHITVHLRPDGIPNPHDVEAIKQKMQEKLGKDLAIDIVVSDKQHITSAGKQKLIESHLSEEDLQ
ncbi:MAG: phenylacetate--CoA ligase family protein [Candidatus Omnitrophica bacterium]|nr:phenylacetate--CoA ligase family protein [Candidatus Omnitrophota bacterium]